MDEIAGKRGLIQRAVDSYRNRYPSMRSRRVARQEKLLKGTLRKRKQSPVSGDDLDGPSPCKLPHLATEVPVNTSYSSHSINNNNNNNNDNSARTTHCYSSLSSPSPSASPTASCGKIPSIYPFYEKTNRAHPKTVTIDDRGVKCRIRINIDCIDLSVIDDAFRKSNCVYPRALNVAFSPNLTQRRQDEAKCNEIGWKLVRWTPTWNDYCMAFLNLAISRFLIFYYRHGLIPSTWPGKRTYSNAYSIFTASNLSLI
jgi:hypothetical protein